MTKFYSLFGNLGYLSLIKLYYGDISWYILEIRWCAALGGLLSFFMAEFSW
jgi:hypothetical protein